jgi:transmembrane sensor
VTDINQHQGIFENAELISKHLRGELNEHEQRVLDKWLAEDKCNSLFLLSLTDETALKDGLQFFESIDISSAWQTIAPQTSQKRDLNRWRQIAKWKYAALITFFVASASIFYISVNRKDTRAVAQKVNLHYQDDVLPGGDKALLELADGSIVVLDKISDGSLQHQGGTQVIKQAGKLIYNTAGENHAEKISYNKISTPKGGQYRVILPDGSKVWLNAGSSLRFPTVFSDKERLVELTGEAYFEIAKRNTVSPGGKGQVRVPFKVQTNDVTIEVLGTHFNVMAYTREGSINTTLIEGSVKVSSASNSRLLKPGQQAKVNGDIDVVNADTEEVIAWKNGFFQFNGADVKTVMGQIERWYDVEVAYEGGMPSRHFTGVISRNNNVSKVLDMLELTGGVKFEITAKKITVVNKM